MDLKELLNTFFTDTSPAIQSAFVKPAVEHYLVMGQWDIYLMSKKHGHVPNMLKNGVEREWSQPAVTNLSP